MRRDRRQIDRMPDAAIGGIPVCTAVIGSMTQAMAAQSVLADAAIPAELAKISSSITHNGCAYGLDFPCTREAQVRAVLGRTGVRVRQYLK